MKRNGKVIPIMFIILFVFQVRMSQNTEGATGIANLVLRTNGGGVRPDYALFIARDLRVLGIEVEIRVEEWTVFFGALLETHDYDMGIVSLSGGGASPDMRNLYTEEAIMNIFGLDKNIPYGNESEIMQNAGVTITDLEFRQQHYYDWQQLIMDCIVPMLPLFAPQSYVGTWANTLGYDGRWDIVDSLPYIEYDGYHKGQDSLTEFNLADTNWFELNPMFVDSYFHYNTIGRVINEELMTFSPDFAPLKTGLVEDWEQLDECHYKFYMRDNVFWNPSYDITERDENSLPLSSIPSAQLVRGLKNNEYSDGTNQQVTAKDAVFTLLLWANPVISESTSYHEWISNIYVDPVDPLAFHVHIDGKPETPEPDYYPDFWEWMNWIVMPEFFLNSTNPAISYTSGGVKCAGLYWDMVNSPQWRMYSLSQFGCGKYMLDYAIKNEKTVLRVSPYWMGIGAIDGTIQDLDIETIIVSVIPDISDKLAAFLAGQLDWTGLTAFPFTRRQMDKDPRFTVQSFVGPSMSFLFFNLQRPFMGGANNYVYLDVVGKEEYTVGVATRKAICYAIDRDEMNQEIHNGDYVIAHSVLYPYTGYYYYDDIVKYNYDLYTVYDWLIAASYPTGDLPSERPDENYWYDTCYCPSPSPNDYVSIISVVVILGLLSLVFKIRKPIRRDS